MLNAILMERCVPPKRVGTLQLVQPLNRLQAIFPQNVMDIGIRYRGRHFENHGGFVANPSSESAS